MIKYLLLCSMSLATVFGNTPAQENSSKKLDSNSSHTNVVIIFLDDAGWEDFQPFGQDHFLTPHVKSLAQEGSLFSQFYVPQAICSASGRFIKWLLSRKNKSLWRSRAQWKRSSHQICNTCGTA